MIMVALMVSACAQKPLISQQNFDQIEILSFAPSADVQEISGLFVEQDSSQMGVQFGLMGAVMTTVLDAQVNRDRSERATNAVIPFNQLVDGSQFPDWMDASLKAAASSTGKSTSDMPGSDAHIIFKPQYGMSSDARTLQVSIEAKVVAPSTQNKPSRPLYVSWEKTQESWDANSLEATIKEGMDKCSKVLLNSMTLDNSFDHENSVRIKMLGPHGRLARFSANPVAELSTDETEFFIVANRRIMGRETSPDQ